MWADKSALQTSLKLSDAAVPQGLFVLAVLLGSQPGRGFKSPCQILANFDPNTASQIQREVTSPKAEVEWVHRDTARYKESAGECFDLGIPCSIHLSYRDLESRV